MEPKKIGRALMTGFNTFWNDVTAPKWIASWEKLRDETNAELITPQLWRAGELRIPHRSFLITVISWISSDGNGTKFRTEMNNPTGFECNIHPRTMLDGIRETILPGAYFTGYRDFDDAFHCSSNSNAELSRLLENVHLRDTIAQQTDCALSFTEKPVHQSGRLTQKQRAGIAILEIRTDEAITDIDRLRGLVELHRQVLDGLIEISVIADR